MVMENWRGEVDDSEGFLTVMEDFRCDDSGSEGLLMLEGLRGDGGGSEDLLMVMEDLRVDDDESEGLMVVIEDWRGEGNES